MAPPDGAPHGLTDAEMLRSGTETARVMPKVGVVTVNYNGGPFIAAFAGSISKLTYPSYRLVVVDNASSDGSAEEIARLLPEAVLLRNPENLGITGGNNRGIAYCLEEDFDYVLFINNDTEVEPDLLERLLEVADHRTMVAPRVYLWGQPGLLDDTAGSFDRWRGVWRPWPYGKPPLPDEGVHPVEMASLCCLLVPAGLLREVGLMDDAFFMYYDDFDFMARALGRGCRLLLNPRAVIYHRKAASSGLASPFKVYYATRNRTYFLRRHLSRPRFALFLAYFLAGRSLYALAYLMRGRMELLKAMALGLRDYFQGRMGRTFLPSPPGPAPSGLSPPGRSLSEAEGPSAPPGGSP